LIAEREKKQDYSGPSRRSSSAKAIVRPLAQLERRLKKKPHARAQTRLNPVSERA